VRFTLNGPGTLLAVGNGDGTSKEPYRGDQRALFNGRALVVVQSSRTPGAVRLTANAPALTAAETSIETERTNTMAELP
jgi:beta-galactosidase